MKRGDIVTVAVNGDYGKPRPALIIQSDAAAYTDSVLVCLTTTTIRAAPAFRLFIGASSSSGLHQDSDVMVDKIVAVRRSRCGPPIGRASQTDIASINRMLVLITGAAD